jgi:hypothetical protein
VFKAKAASAQTLSAARHFGADPRRLQREKDCIIQSHREKKRRKSEIKADAKSVAQPTVAFL